MSALNRSGNGVMNPGMVTVQRRSVMNRPFASIGLVVLLGCLTTLIAQSSKLSDQEFKQVAQSHSNAAEHQKLAAHYTAHAIEHESDAKVHEDLAAQYAKTEPRLSGEARHYAAHSRESAEALRELAKIHQDLAKEHAAKK
jgi:hypothetical protein